MHVINCRKGHVMDKQTGKSYEILLEAKVENVGNVQDFIKSHLTGTECSPKALMQIDLAAEEIFVNIANYAYTPDDGDANVRVEVLDEPVTVIITFIDHGKPYDPLKRDDPDISLPAEERDIGGLGIFLTKTIMDEVIYEYVNNSNILTLKKKL